MTAQSFGLLYLTGINFKVMIINGSIGSVLSSTIKWEGGGKMCASGRLLILMFNEVDGSASRPSLH